MTIKKSLFILLFICVVVPMTAQATVTRVIGLGGQDANYIIKDAFNPTVWPQLVVDNPNLAGGEFFTDAQTGNFGFQKAYVNYSFREKQCALQFSLDQMSGLNSMFGQSYPLAPALTEVGGFANKFSIIYGRKIQDFKIGLGMSYSGHSRMFDPTDTSFVSGGGYQMLHADKQEKTAGILGFNLGFTGFENKLDAALGYEMANYTDKAGTSADIYDSLYYNPPTLYDYYHGRQSQSRSWEDDGAGTLQFVARYWYQYSEQCALIPTLRFVSMKDAAKSKEVGQYDQYITDDTLRYYTDRLQTVTTDSTQSRKYTDIRLSFGHNWKPVENTLVVFEVGVDIMSRKTETSYTQRMDTSYRQTMPRDTAWTHSSSVKRSTSSKVTYQDLPFWRLGFETKIFDWLNGRFGAERYWATDITDKQSFNYPKRTDTYSFTRTYLGATAHWNRLYLDLLIEPTFLKNGPDFISGSSTNGLFSRVSLKYDFNN